MKIIALFLVLITPLLSLGESRAQSTATVDRFYSSKRLPNESYLSKLARFKKGLQVWRSELDDSKDAESEKVSFEKLDESRVQTWNGSVDFETFFKNIRDERFLRKNSNFPRRITWLYPDDGCFARAAIVSQKSKAFDYSGGSKIFAFGDLNVKTNNATFGYVTWWYHVASAYRLQNTVYVIDPSIEPDRPLRLEEWLSSMGDIHQIEVSICNAEAYHPGSPCNPKSSIFIQTASDDIEKFLQPEWDRLEDLGRHPDKELGDEPPWKKTSN